MALQQGRQGPPRAVIARGSVGLIPSASRFGRPYYNIMLEGQHLPHFRDKETEDRKDPRSCPGSPTLAGSGT